MYDTKKCRITLVAGKQELSLTLVNREVTLVPLSGPYLYPNPYGSGLLLSSPANTTIFTGAAKNGPQGRKETVLLTPDTQHCFSLSLPCEFPW